MRKCFKLLYRRFWFWWQSIVYCPYCKGDGCTSHFGDREYSCSACNATGLRSDYIRVAIASWIKQTRFSLFRAKYIAVTPDYRHPVPSCFDCRYLHVHYSQFPCHDCYAMGESFRLYFKQKVVR